MSTVLLFAEIILFTGGVGLSLGTSGYPLVAAAIAGGLSVGAGASMINHPISKMILGERMTGKDFVEEVATGSVVGILTGGIGAGRYFIG
jgi:hypothetical protein